MKQPLYKHIATTIQARLNCRLRGNDEWFGKHTDVLEHIARNILPSGSGIDSGTTIDLERSTGDRIVLNTSYHHMNDGGMYDGWTEHTITIRPSLQFDFELTVSGRNRNDIKEYLSDVFSSELREAYEHTYDKVIETHDFARIR